MTPHDAIDRHRSGDDEIRASLGATLRPSATFVFEGEAEFVVAWSIVVGGRL
jgi:hypothetical protein